MKNLVFLLFVMLSIPVTAQNVFSPGYVVTSEGDTIRGLILEKSDAEMSRRLIFKSSEDAEIQKHSVSSLSVLDLIQGGNLEEGPFFPNQGRMKIPPTFLPKIYFAVKQMYLQGGICKKDILRSLLIIIPTILRSIFTERAMAWIWKNF